MPNISSISALVVSVSSIVSCSSAVAIVGCRAQLGQDRGDFKRMGEIGIAGGAFLVPVRPHRIDIGPVEQRLVRIRIVAENLLDKLILPHHDGMPSTRLLP